MSDRGLSINRIDIHRVPGVPRNRGFTVPWLFGGINVIYRLNGSGKSTTARCLQGLLWPAGTSMDRPTFSGEFVFDGNEWNIELEAGHAQARRDGNRADPPQLGPAENRHRYHLALDQLLQKEADPWNFAKIIAEESRGGYDLEGAAEALGFRDKPKRPTRERRALDEAKQARIDAQQKQEVVERSATDLEGLRRKPRKPNGVSPKSNGQSNTTRKTLSDEGSTRNSSDFQTGSKSSTVTIASASTTCRHNGRSRRIRIPRRQSFLPTMSNA
jgi:energy-coupling factor transporter ATP-binding protein EcfA2